MTGDGQQGTGHSRKRLLRLARESQIQTSACRLSPVTCHLRKQSGVTLIELVISIVIITTAVAAVLGVFSFTANQSADAMVRAQAVAIAQAYLEEIQLKSYNDPGGGTESGRADYDDVSDYHGLSDTSGARDQLNNIIEGLESYRVNIAVVDSMLNGVNAKRIDITVTHTLGHTTRLSGYRTGY